VGSQQDVEEDSTLGTIYVWNLFIQKIKPPAIVTVFYG
jgi:hypothetical protein